MNKLFHSWNSKPLMIKKKKRQIVQHNHSHSCCCRSSVSYYGERTSTVPDTYELAGKTRLCSRLLPNKMTHSRTG